MEIRENVILAAYTTFRIGGLARYFCEVESVDDLKSALKFSKENNLRFFVLGGGSNILVSDKGFNGLVIKMGIKGLEFKDKGGYSILSAGAGENWDYLVEQAVERNLGGIENLSWVPGSVGGAVHQNIGCYGTELKDVLDWADVLDCRTNEICRFTNNDCCFGYHESVFINNAGRFIILQAGIKLSKNPAAKIIYPDLIKYFKNSGEKPDIEKVRIALSEIRKAKGTKLKFGGKIGNAGSFFKNPTIKISNFQFLISKHPDLKGFDRDNGLVKLSAAQLIEKCGWKGKMHGGVGVSPKHTLVLVNYGKGTAEEIINLAKDIKMAVKNKFGVELEPEVEIVGGA